MALGALLAASLGCCSRSPERVESNESPRRAVMEDVVLRVDDDDAQTVVEADRGEFDDLPVRSSAELWGVHLTRGEGPRRVEASAERASLDADGGLILRGAEVDLGGVARLKVEELRADVGRGEISGRGVRASFEVEGDAGSASINKIGSH